jgi:hypothetical protein
MDVDLITTNIKDVLVRLISHALFSTTTTPKHTSYNFLVNQHVYQVRITVKPYCSYVRIELELNHNRSNGSYYTMPIMITKVTYAKLRKFHDCIHTFLLLHIQELQTS